jgi:hypothetical protein
VSFRPSSRSATECLTNLANGKGGEALLHHGGKNAQVRVQRVDQPGVTETRMWGSYEKVSVKRA